MSRSCFNVTLAVLLATSILSAQTSPETLARSVTIYRDSYGVPHIFGKSDAAVVFGLMYAQCEDNFWQLETDFIRSTGRAAELEGEKGLSSDLAYRAFEVERLSKAEYERLPRKAKELCEAYAAGLNYFLARNSRVKPRLIARFEPWHILAVNRSSRTGNISRFGSNRNEIRFGVLESPSAPEQYGERQRPENDSLIESQVADASRTAPDAEDRQSGRPAAPGKRHGRGYDGPLSDPGVVGLP